MDETRERLRAILADSIPLTPYAMPTVLDKILALLPQWISVEDRLPEDDLSMWVLTYEPVFMIQYCARGSAVWNNTTPTHWMPLPTPPKEGE